MGKHVEVAKFLRGKVEKLEADEKQHFEAANTLSMEAQKHLEKLLEDFKGYEEAGRERILSQRAEHEALAGKVEMLSEWHFEVAESTKTCRKHLGDLDVLLEKVEGSVSESLKDCVGKEEFSQACKRGEQ